MSEKIYPKWPELPDQFIEDAQLTISSIYRHYGYGKDYGDLSGGGGDASEYGGDTYGTTDLMGTGKSRRTHYGPKS